jgi:hypothetical protein
MPGTGTRYNPNTDQGSVFSGSLYSDAQCVLVILAGNSSFLFSDPLVNMEVCGARLSQREALLFRIPGTSTNLRRAVPKLRMIDTASTSNDEEVP